MQETRVWFLAKEDPTNAHLPQILSLSLWFWFVFPRWYSEHLFMYLFSSVAQSCPTLCYPMNHSTPGLPVHHQLPEFNQTHVHWVGDAIQPSHPLLSPSPPAPIPPSIRVFSNESTLPMRWPKYWSFSFSISLGYKQRSFCRFWDCIQVLHFGLFCWPWWLLHFF